MVRAWHHLQFSPITAIKLRNCFKVTIGLMVKSLIDFLYLCSDWVHWYQWRLLRGERGGPSLPSEFHQMFNCKTLKKLYFLDKTTLNIITSPNNWLKHTILQRSSTVASTLLCRVAPWCSRRTASCPPLGTLTSIQNLGGSLFSPLP
jgi:hypothetical protein